VVLRPHGPGFDEEQDDEGHLGEYLRNPVVQEESVPDEAQLRVGQNSGKGFGDPLPQEGFRVAEDFELAVLPAHGFLLVLASVVQVFPKLETKRKLYLLMFN